MPANLENSAVATGLEKVSFHPNAKKRQTVSFQMFKLVLEKAEEPEIKLPTSVGKSKRLPDKTSISALLTMPKSLTVWITINCGQF